ncbi:MAG: hypothetical protein K2K56_06485 [Lachnospiraceae bacterium]|nr:hypothetical protein [Lachnospiraceae bacterium]
MKAEIIVLGFVFLINKLKAHGFTLGRKELIYDVVKSTRLSVLKRFIKTMVPIICITIYFIWGIVCFYKGYRENSEFNNIVECGEKVKANVVKEMGERKSYEPIETRQYIYLVEFVIGGEKQQGRMLATKYLHSGDDVYIYYLKSSLDKTADIAIEDGAFYPGNNMIHHGISRFAMGFFFYILLKEIVE